MFQKKLLNDRKSFRIGFGVLIVFFLLVVQNTLSINQSSEEVITSTKVIDNFSVENSVKSQEEIEETTKIISSETKVDDGLKVVVIRVVDGDTFKIKQNQKEETVRVIGINTPETVHPSKPVECMGKEASLQATKLLEQKTVILTEDETQGKYDKYGRLLGYVTLPDGSDFGGTMLKGGYAYEYTYNLPYEKQNIYKEAENFARENKIGLWAKGVCENLSVSATLLSDKQGGDTNKEIKPKGTENCIIKGNISTNTGEKIYHVPNQQYYNKTVISEDKGERWFCSEEEAREAGWRKAFQ